MQTLEQRIQGVAALGAMLTDYFLHGEKAPIYLDLEEALQKAEQQNDYPPEHSPILSMATEGTF